MYRVVIPGIQRTLAIVVGKIAGLSFRLIVLGCSCHLK